MSFRDDDRRKKDDIDDPDSKRGPNWNKRDDSPRRGRGGSRGRNRRNERRGDSSNGRQRQRKGDVAARSRSRSRGREDSLDKSGSIELRLDTSRELLNSPRKQSLDNSESRKRKDDNNEDLAEDFSDFGDSDDDILNQEESDSRDLKDSRPSSRLSQSDDKKDDLDEFNDSNISSVNESEETLKTNARVADALGADWSQLLSKEKTPSSTPGDARKRWTLPEIIKRVGLSKDMMGGEEPYNKFLDKLNADLPDDEKVVLLDDRPWMHAIKLKKQEREKSLFTDIGGCRALSARADINIRRKLNGIMSEDDGLPVSRVNTNMELWQVAKDNLMKKRKLIEESQARVNARIAASKQQPVC